MPAASARGAAPPLQPSQLSGPEGLKARENMIRGMFTPATPPALQQHVLKMMLAAPEATAGGAMLATFDASNWTDDVMTMPVLGIYAEKSQLGNPEYSKKIFPAFEYIEVPGTGHFVMMEKPREFNQVLTTFLNKIDY
jgi:pimeloyl-ACP methyl ester carboxylesterase